MFRILLIHFVVCLTTGPKPLPKRALHIVRSRASSFKWEYPLLSLRSSSSFLRLLPRLPVTSSPPFIFPSITRCRRQFLRKMWPIQFAFRLRISCRIFHCSLTPSNVLLLFFKLASFQVTGHWWPFIHLFSSLSYDRSKASSKASPPHSAIQSFLLQMRVTCSKSPQPCTF